MEHNLRIIISGGGTGGHIFPAVAIANALRARYPDFADKSDAEVLAYFNVQVGA